MKKKSLMVLITCTVMIAMFGIVATVSAERPFNKRALFETDIVPVGTEPLLKGEVWIRENGEFKVEVEGAAVEIEGVPVEEYDVFLMYGDIPSQISLGSIEIDEEGEGMHDGTVPLSPNSFTNPWIEIRFNDVVYYVSGFELELIPIPGPGPGPVEY